MSLHKLIIHFSYAEFSIHQRLITVVPPTGSALVIVCLLLFCISFVCCIKYWRNDRKDECNKQETNRLCNALRKVLRNPRSTCDERCEKVGLLIDFFLFVVNGTQSDFSQQIEEKEPEIVGTQSSPSSSTSCAPGNSSCGPPHPGPQLLPASPSHAVYDNNNQQVSVMMPCSSKIKDKGGKPSKKRRKNDKVKPYKKCTREEAIQLAKGLLSG